MHISWAGGVQCKLTLSKLGQTMEALPSSGMATPLLAERPPSTT